VTWEDALRFTPFESPGRYTEPGRREFEATAKILVFLPGLAVDALVFPFVALADGWGLCLYRRWDARVSKRFLCFYPVWLGLVRRGGPSSREPSGLGTGPSLSGGGGCPALDR
jgi:hypothetical protein